MVLSDGFVDRFVLTDPVQEVDLRFLGGHVLVVWISGTDFQRNVSRDYRRIVANRFQENQNKALFLRDSSFNLSPSG